MRRPLGFAFLVVALVLPSATVGGQGTQVIGFEGLAPGLVPAGYEGLTWSTGFNFWHTALSGTLFRPSSGAVNAASEEGAFVTFSRPGDLFTLNSMFLSEFLSGPPERTELIGVVAGYRDNQVVYSMDLSFDRGTMTQYDFNWADIDMVTIGGIKGNVLIDDISLTTTPEPATVVLVGTGLLGVLAVRRRKSRARATVEAAA